MFLKIVVDRRNPIPYILCIGFFIWRNNMTHESSNLTNAEYYKLNGSLSKERISDLLDKDSAFDAGHIENAQTKIEEARNCFPDETTLSGSVSDLNALLKDLCGKNKEILSQIIKELEQDIETILQQADYGRSELSDADDELLNILYPN